jgi:DNA mismatch endonuclease (patch repair protein)
MRAIRSSSMRPELVVRRLVHKLGFRFRLHRHDLPGRPDLVFSSRRKIIQVHGRFWHQHAGCKLSHLPKSRPQYWLPKLERNRLRDIQNLDRLEQLGWSVLVVWECETAKIDALETRIRIFLSADSRKIKVLRKGDKGRILTLDCAEKPGSKAAKP